MESSWSAIPGGANVDVSGGLFGTSTASPDVLTVKNGASLTADTVTVYSNGTLNGNGTIYGDVTLSGGSVAPGNSPGTLTIDGNYTQESGSVLIIEIAGTNTGEFDVLNILGTATFEAGTTIDLKFIDGFAPSTDEVFDFLLADTFASDMNLVDFVILGLEPGFQFDVGFTDACAFNMTALNDGVSEVPLPGAVRLFSFGLIGLIGIAKRRKAA